MPRGGEGPAPHAAAALAGAVDPFALPVRPPPLPHAPFEDDPDTDEHLIANLAQREHSAEPTTPSGLQRVRQSQKPHRVGLVTRQADDGSYEMVYANLDEDDDAPEHHEPPPQVPLFRRPAVQIAALLAVLLAAGLSITLAALLSQDDEPRQIKRAPVDKAAGKGADGPYEYVAPQNHNNKLDLDDNDGEDDGEPKPRPAQAAPQPAPEPQDAPGADLNASGPNRGFQPSPPGLNINKPIPEIRAGAAPLIGERLRAAQAQADEADEADEDQEEVAEEDEGEAPEEEPTPSFNPPGDDERYLNLQGRDEENTEPPEEEAPEGEELPLEGEEPSP